MPGNKQGPASRSHRGKNDRGASKFRAEALTDFLAGWQAEHGVVTAKELAEAGRELGLAAADAAT
jgi:hypothetical protein